jgi:hypothetical protein
MSSPTRRRRCTRCERLRRRDSFARTWKPGWCRSCRAELVAKRDGDRKILNIIRAFAAYDDELFASLGPRWPQRLLRAKEDGR